MKKKLLLNQLRLYVIGLIILLMCSNLVNAQVLVNYPLRSNLNPDVGPMEGMQIPGETMLRFTNAAGNNKATNHTSNYLNFTENNDQLILTFNATNYNGMTLQFSGGLGVFFALASGSIKVYMSIDNGSDVLLENRAFSAFLFGSDTYNFSINIPNADNKGRVRIRIVGGLNYDWGVYSYFGVRNLSISSANTTMRVNASQINPATEFPNINHDAAASVELDTDFGSVYTDEGVVTKRYRITNTGSRVLTISNIIIDNPNQGFSIDGTKPTSVAVNASAFFNVRFAPIEQGVKSANVVINSNALPNTTFEFEVKGSAKSCNLVPVAIATNHFEANASLPLISTSGSPKLVGGKANALNPNNLGSGRRLYPDGNLYSTLNTNLSANATEHRAIMIGGETSADYDNITGTGEVTMEFGPIDITGQSEVSLNFDIAAFGMTNDNTAGVNGTDYVMLSVKMPNGNWQDQVLIRGSQSAEDATTENIYDNTRSKYAFGQQIYSKAMNNALVKVNNDIRVNRFYGGIKLNIPISYLQNNFTFRIKAKASQTRYRPNIFSSYRYYNRNYWMIDNVNISAGNVIAKSWNGTAWTGGRPNVNGRDKAIFTNGNYSFDAVNENSDMYLCECEVRNTANLTVPVSRTLRVRNKVANYGTGPNFTIEDGGYLMQDEESVVNTGNVRVLKNINLSNDRKQFNYISSPTINTNLKTILPGIPTVLYHSENSNYFGSSSGAYIQARGLAVSEPSTAGVESSTVAAEFIGVPFNGKAEYTLAYTTTKPNVAHGYNLVGNPYPSNLDLVTFYEKNQNLISPTIYFWDNRGNTIFEQMGSGYSMGNYATFNAISGTGLAAPSAVGGSKKPSRYTHIGQGFMVRALNASSHNKSLVFDHTMRIAQSQGSGMFGRKNEKKSPHNRFWVSLVTPRDLEISTAVVYFQDGKVDFGPDDSALMISGSDQIYSLVENQKLGIQGLPNFESNETVKLGTNFFYDDNYTIRLLESEGIFENEQPIYLKDKHTGIITDLTKGDYTFKAEKGLSEDRFEIVYKIESTLDVVDKEIKSSDVKVYRDGEYFVAKSTSKIMNIQLFNISGQYLITATPEQKEYKWNHQLMNKGVYIVKMQLENGEIKTKKIIK